MGVGERLGRCAGAPDPQGPAEAATAGAVLEAHRGAQDCGGGAAGRALMCLCLRSSGEQATPGHRPKEGLRRQPPPPHTHTKGRCSRSAEGPPTRGRFHPHGALGGVACGGVGVGGGGGLLA